MQALLAEARFNQLDGTERRLKDAQDAQARYRQERDEARVEAGVLRCQVMEYRGQAARYRGERDLYRTDRDAVRAQRDQYLVERDQYLAERDQHLAARAHRDRVRSLSSENDWSRERDVWGREKDILQGEHRELRDAVSGLRGESDMLREENRDLREDNEELRAEVLRLRLAARGQGAGPENLLLPGVPRRSSSGAPHSGAGASLGGPPFSATSRLPPLITPYAPNVVSSSALPLQLASMNVISRIPSPPPIKEEECW
ncbi:hypothetical protein EV121DRAFT_212281 [Schizophyllum commune]